MNASSCKLIQFFQLRCNFSDNKQAISAYERAKTSLCKDEIEHAACFFKSIVSLGEPFNYVRLKSRCPFVKPSDEPVLQVEASELISILNESNQDSFRSVPYSDRLALNKNGHAICRDICLTYHAMEYAAFRRDLEDNTLNFNSSLQSCICLKDLKSFDLSLNDSYVSSVTETKTRYFDLFKTGLFSKIF